MTKDELKEYGLAMVAMSEGKTTQMWNGLKWVDCDGDLGEINLMRFRPKPEPAMRPWSKPDDVPGPVCWVRFKRDVVASAIIVSVDSCGIRTAFCHSGWSEMKEWEHSTDRKTWHKCEVPV